MPSPTLTITELKAQWSQLCDLDRARAVRSIKQSGLSTREIAHQLCCSESYLRHLLIGLLASREDRVLARNGKISTRELVRRVKAAGLEQEIKHQEAHKLKQVRASVQACKAICDWLVSEDIGGPEAELIIDETRRYLFDAEQSKKLPLGAAPFDMPTAEIVSRCRPLELKTDEFTSTAWFASWLTLWTYYSFTDTWVRDTALELALEQQFKNRIICC